MRNGQIQLKVFGDWRERKLPYGDDVCIFTLTFPPQDIEVTSSPDDSIGCLSFSPPTLPGNFLIAGSWANDVSAPQATAMH